jgi:mannose-6-phosphate isomerase-like protein (cupin superfamily)
MSAEDVTYTSIDGDAAEQRFLSLRRALGVESFGLNLIVLEPGMRMRVHRHREQEEVYLVWSGELTLELEGAEQRVLKRGEVVRVPPPVRRRIMNAGSERLELIALGGAGEHEARDGEAFDSWESDEPKPPRDVPLPSDL